MLTNSLIVCMILQTQMNVNTMRCSSVIRDVWIQLEVSSVHVTKVTVCHQTEQIVKVRGHCSFCHSHWVEYQTLSRLNRWMPAISIILKAIDTANSVYWTFYVCYVHIQSLFVSTFNNSWLFNNVTIAKLFSYPTITSGVFIQWNYQAHFVTQL